MPAYIDTKTKKWFVKFYCKDWTGDNKIKWKRGFSTKREALAWEREFKQTQAGSLSMLFSDFLKLYEADRRPRIRLHTWVSKEYIINDKIIPYFGSKPVNQIKSTDIIKWQNALMKLERDDGSNYSPTYLKTINNQLTAIFNHAVKYYGLAENPVHKVGAMGEKHAKEMNFWTREEYMKFSETVKNDIPYYIACEVLYWCGLRVGELLALTHADVDIKNKTINVNKSYQRIKGEDVITEPKTKKSNRVVSIPTTLCQKLSDYMMMFYKPDPGERLFSISKDRLREYITDGANDVGIKRIRIHDFRHSHISLLIDMGFSPLAIADRVGHESIEITFRYAHLFPSTQSEMAVKLDEAMIPDETPDSFSRPSKVVQFKGR